MLEKKHNAGLDSIELKTRKTPPWRHVNRRRSILRVFKTKLRHDKLDEKNNTTLVMISPGKLKQQLLRYLGNFAK